MKLSDRFALHGSDKHLGTSEGHSYGPVYDAVLAPLKGQISRVLEIGVLGGASIRAWRDYFDCQVVGLDVAVESRTEWLITVKKCDATNKEQLDLALDDQTFALIIDDGSHWEEHQLKSFELLKDRLRPGGIYVVEDIQCATSHDKFRELGFRIVDLRQVRHRFDDVLAFYQAPDPRNTLPKLDFSQWR